MLSPELISSINYFLELNVYGKYYIKDLDSLIAKLDLQYGLNNIYGIRLLEKKIMTCTWKSGNEENVLILCEKVENAYIMLNLLETKEHGVFLIVRSKIYMDYGNFILCHYDLLKARAILSSQVNITYDDVYRFQYPIIEYYLKFYDYNNAEIECLTLISSFEEKNPNYNSDYYNLINLLVRYIYFETMQYDKSIERCNDAISKFNSDALVNYSRIIDLKLEIGRALIEKKDFKNATKSLRSTLEHLEFLFDYENYKICEQYYLRTYYKINKLIATAYYEGGFFSSATKVLKLLLNDEYFQKYDCDAQKYKKMMDSVKAILEIKQKIP